jgi:predicted nucleic acid-binding protein
MTAFVVDASALGPFLIPDEVENSIPDMLDLIASDGAIAPQHWKLEIANLLRMAVRRKRMQPDALSGLVKMLGDLDIEIDDSTGQNAWGRTLVLSSQHDLSAYDAAYLELALRIGRPLATLDDALTKAARSEKVELLLI